MPLHALCWPARGARSHKGKSTIAAIAINQACGTVGGEEHYRAYTSRDGTTWVRGGVWTHALGANAKIGLVALGGSGFTARFDYVRVYALQ